MTTEYRYTDEQIRDRLADQPNGAALMAAQGEITTQATEIARLTTERDKAKAEADESWRDLHAVIDCPDCDGTGDSGTGIKDMMGVLDSRTCETCGGDGLSALKRTTTHLATPQAHAERLADAPETTITPDDLRNLADCYGQSATDPIRVRLGLRAAADTIDSLTGEIAALRCLLLRAEIDRDGALRERDALSEREDTLLKRAQRAEQHTESWRREWQKTEAERDLLRELIAIRSDAAPSATAIADTYTEGGERILDDARAKLTMHPVYTEADLAEARRAGLEAAALIAEQALAQYRRDIHTPHYDTTAAIVEQISHEISRRAA